MGEAFATTIEQICKTLNVEVNTFLRSDVGKLTAAVIIYKMVGKDILLILLYVGAWFSVTFFMLMSIKFLYMKKAVKQKVKDPEVKDQDKAPWIITTEYVERFSWGEYTEVKMGSLFAHIVAWFVFSCIIAFYII